MPNEPTSPPSVPNAPSWRGSPPALSGWSPPWPRPAAVTVLAPGSQPWPPGSAGWRPCWPSSWRVRPVFWAARPWAFWLRGRAGLWPNAGPSAWRGIPYFLVGFGRFCPFWPWPGSWAFSGRGRGDFPGLRAGGPGGEAPAGGMLRGRLPAYRARSTGFFPFPPARTGRLGLRGGRALCFCAAWGRACVLRGGRPSFSTWARDRAERGAVWAGDELIPNPGRGSCSRPVRRTPGGAVALAGPGGLPQGGMV
jgi:hypothetical protein